MDITSDFWRWAKTTPEEYARTGIKQSVGMEEFDYPNFDKLTEYAESLLKKNDLSDCEVDTFLTILALDNESENLLDFTIQHILPTQINKIAELGVRHMQPEARWQIAELIFRLKPNGYSDYLRKLSDDRDPYVRKRSVYCLEHSDIK